MESTNTISIESKLEVLVERGTTLFRTCFNGINVLTGVGLLSVPYALSQGGWLSLTMLVMVATLCCYTGLLLHRCVVANPHVKSYPDLGELAFGAKGRVFISILFYLELYFFAIEFLILEGDNLAKLFPNGLGLGSLLGIKIGVKGGFMILTSIIILPTTWFRSLGLLAYVYMGGVFACLLVILSVFWTGMFDGPRFHEKGMLLNWKGVPTSISLFTFCYCGHGVFPTLCISMKNRNQFKKVKTIFLCQPTIILYSYLEISYNSYLVACVVDMLCVKHHELCNNGHYWLYYVRRTFGVSNNLKPSNHKNKLKSCHIHNLHHSLIKICINNYSHSNIRSASISLNQQMVLVISIRTMLVINTLIVALFVPFFGYVMAFIGASLGVTISILLPCLFYLKLSGGRRSCLETKVIIVIFGLGLLAGLMGTYISVRDIVNNLLRS